MLEPFLYLGTYILMEKLGVDIEWFVLFFACILMAKISVADGRSGLTWGVLTFVLCLGTILFIPFPLWRLGIPCVIGFLLMMFTDIGKNSEESLK